MDKFGQICEDIKSLKIQGATSIAKAAIEALQIRHDNASVKKLISLRATEPCLRNAIRFCLVDMEKNPGIALRHFDEAQKTISEEVANKIEGGSIIFTHCHSNNVVKALIAASKKKKFTVYNTETRPRFQGRKTAEELAKAGIPVEHFVDSAARVALKKCDLALIGADAITSEGKVINKIGSEMFAEIADRFDIPFYVCSDSWKYDSMTMFGFEEEIETRYESEVWDKPPRGVKINNISFEKIDPELITGIISDIGVFGPQAFVTEVTRHFPWIQQGRGEKGGSP